MLSSFGEGVTKRFVAEAVSEAMRLENALRTVDSQKAVVVLHYSPIAETLEGEPLEIFPFLGSARMGETIDRFDGVKLVVHGHAHSGAPAGRTPRGIPVHNVARPLLNRQLGKEFAIFDI